jgi:hypothetical protein
MLLAALCLLPYLNKAFTIDDPFFLSEAQQILKTPLRPMSFEICWQGNETCGKASEIAPGAALMGYALLPVVLVNGAEWIAHLEQLLFACVAVMAMAALTIRLGWSRTHALLAGLLIVAIPPFLPMAATAMPDTLSLCLGLAGMERLLAWKEENKWTQAIVAGVTLGIAPYGRPHYVLLLAVGALILRDRRRWAPIVIAILVLSGIILLTHERGVVLRSSGSSYGAESVVRNLQSYFFYLAFPMPLAAAWISANWRKAPALFCVIPAAGALTIRLVFGPGRLAAWEICICLAAAAVVCDMLFRAWKSREPTRIALALWLMIPLPIAMYAHFPIKYLLAVSPVVILTLFQIGEIVPRRAALIAGVLLAAAGTAYSCVILHTDAGYAELSREAAREIVAPHAAAGEKVWFGGQWGFYWYAQRAGARLSEPGVEGPRPGDLLAVAQGPMGGQHTLNRFPQRSLLRTFSRSCDCGRTTVSRAGLYTNFSSNFLWLWASGEVARFELWRIH